MRLTCPCCGSMLSLEVLLNDAAARQAVASALSLPAGLGSRLLRYIGLFRPPQRSLTWDRAAKLLDELQQMITAGQIQRHGRAWAAPHVAWQSALDALFERQGLQLPLKSHGYLLEIIAGLANQTEAVAETAAEQRRHQPRDRDPSGGMNAVSALLATMPAAISQREECRETMRENSPTQAIRPRTTPPAEFTALRQSLSSKTSPAPDPAPPPA